jgi:amino acid adenylation domain-containing protein
MLMRLEPQNQVLLVTLHHIISDGWSMGVLWRELSVLYDAFRSGQPSPLEELPIQYADYAVWQREWSKGQVFDAQLRYWREQLKDAPPLLKIATDRCRPSVQKYRGRKLRLRLPGDLGRSLKELSRREDVTLFMLLLAGFKVLLYRYAAQEDIVVGTPIAGRTHRETEGLIGLFVNTLVLRTDLSKNPTFQEVLVRVRKVALEAFGHQELPFEKLVEELKPERTLSYSPLFQVMLVLQNTSRLDRKRTHFQAAKRIVDNGTAKFDLTLFLIDSSEGMMTSLEYNASLFEAGTIRRMLRHLQTLLQDIVTHPEKHISELAFLTQAEREQVLVAWNDTGMDYPQNRCIHELFEKQVERSPDAVALVYEGQELTYHGLNSRANQLARYLRRIGVGPEVLAGVCMERSVDMVVALLGVLKAGGAYVPLDPAYPKERLNFLLNDAEVSVLLTQKPVLSQLPFQEVSAVCMDTDWTTICAENQENLVTIATADNLAYAIYTSGSTGKPKGVAIAHRSAVALIHWAKSIFTAKDLAGILASTSICFDLSIFELFVSLSWGGKIILAKDVLQLPALASAENVTLINTVPSAIVELIRVGAMPSSVRIVNLAGEPLTTALVKQLYEEVGTENVFDLYGPSEDTTYSTFALRNKRGPATIGRPIANTQIYLLDAHLQALPFDKAGELWIGGDGLARCYLKRADLTAERFLPNPFCSEPGKRLYKTGDWGRYFPDGSIEFLGRVDHQEKIRGFRIELGEIEAVLSQQSLVRAAVVVAREDESKGKYLVSYIVPNGSAPTASELSSFLKSKLPEYMVPTTFVFLEAFPVTPNGKVDRKKLPVPQCQDSTARAAYVMPRTEVEQRVAEVWREVLRVGTVGVDDNFFDLGGHSLLLLQVQSRLQYDFECEVPVVVLFQYPTVRLLANYLTGHVKSSIPSRLGYAYPETRRVAMRQRAQHRQVHRMEKKNKGGA